VSRGAPRLERDREREPGAAGLEPLPASGGSILYMGVGACSGLGRLGVAFGVKRAAATALHEASEQQGSEGLEAFRATAVVTWAMGL
jgi:F0F1-type ATP synthase membrane subunit c/vacuolar-type H+-ATPase subunit K